MVEKYEGLERRQKNTQGRREKDKPIHPWRWRALVAWIIVFTVITMYGLRTSRDAATEAQKSSKEAKILAVENKKRITEVREQSAKLHALQRTNCRLTVFLLTARRARWDQYREHHDKADLAAVKAYEQIVDPYLRDQDSVGVDCAIPKRILIKKRPLPTPS